MTAKDGSTVKNRAYVSAVTYMSSPRAESLPQDYVWGMGARAIQSHIRHYPESITSPYFSPGIASTDGSGRFGHLLPNWFKRKSSNGAPQNGHAKAVADGNGNAPGAANSGWSGTKVYVHCGTAELLHDQDKVLAELMKREGVDVRLREVSLDAGTNRYDSADVVLIGRWRHTCWRVVQAEKADGGDQEGLARILANNIVTCFHRRLYMV